MVVVGFFFFFFLSDGCDVFLMKPVLPKLIFSCHFENSVC